VTGSNSVTVASTSGLVAGMGVTGPNIPVGATVLAVTDSTHFTLAGGMTATGSSSGVSLTAAFGSTFDQLLTVNNQGAFTSNTNNIYAKGVLVDNTGFFNSSTGNNVFGTTPNGTDGAIFNHSGGANLTGANVFNGPLVLNSNNADVAFALAVGNAVNPSTFKGPVTVNSGSLTVGATTNGAFTIGGGATTTPTNPRLVTVTNTSQLAVGMQLTGTGIPGGATITQINSGTTFTMSADATSAQTGQTYTFIPVVGTTVGSQIVSVSSTLGLTKGMSFVSPGVPLGATISDITSVNSIVISLPASATLSNQTLTASGNNTFEQAVAINNYANFTDNGNNTFAGLSIAQKATVGGLNGNNTFGGTGLTFNNVGSLTMAGNNTLNGPLTINNSLLLTMSGINAFSSSISLGGGGTNANGSLTANNLANTLNITGNISVANYATMTVNSTGIGGVSGTTSVSNFGSLTLPGNNVFGGLVSVSGISGTYDNASLSVGSGPILATATTPFVGITTNTFSAGVNAVTNRGNLLFGGNNIFGGPTTLSTAMGNLSLPGNNSFTGNLVLNAPGAASGVVPMGGTNTYTGAITLNGGNFVMTGSNTGFTSLTLNNGATVTLGIAAGATPASTPLSLNGAGATVVMNESQTWGSLTGALDTRILVAAGKVFTSTDSSASPITLATNITGAGSFTKAGSADMNIVAPQSFQGTFTIGGGTVSLLPSPQFANVNGLIGDKAAVVIQSGALNLNGRSETIGSLEGAGNVLLGADGQLTVGGNNLTPAGALSGNILGSGSAGLTKVGGGTLTLSGTNTFPGALNILGGGLVLANPAGGTLNSAVKADLSLPGASLTVNSDQALAGLTGAGGSSVAIGSGATLTVNYVDSAPITAKATLAGGSRELVNFGEPYTTDLTAGMKITLGSGILIPSFVVQVLGAGRTGGAGVLVNNATKDPASDTFGFVKVGVLNSALTGQGDFNKTGSGTLIMTGKNTNSGYTGIANGTLMLGGIAVNGEYIFQNILSDQSELRFGTTGTPTLNLADNTLNLQP
ncbi:MAG: hypothetical protein JWO08_4716, partial [Verrucomicrobiaceae bacterium]|nr:hypothetical protein [Verrucomicrobiaceae bacterium]